MNVNKNAKFVGNIKDHNNKTDKSRNVLKNESRQNREVFLIVEEKARFMNDPKKYMIFFCYDTFRDLKRKKIENEEELEDFYFHIKSSGERQNMIIKLDFMYESCRRRRQIVCDNRRH